MNPENVNAIADSVADLFAARDGRTPARLKDALYGSLYLLLAEEAEDGLGALFLLMDRDDKVALALWGVVKGLPAWAEEDCASVLTVFGRLVTPAPKILSTADLRERASSFVRRFQAIAEDPAAAAPYAALLKDFC